MRITRTASPSTTHSLLCRVNTKRNGKKKSIGNKKREERQQSVKPTSPFPSEARILNVCTPAAPPRQSKQTAALNTWCATGLVRRISGRWRHTSAWQSESSRAPTDWICASTTTLYRAAFPAKPVRRNWRLEGAFIDKLQHRLAIAFYEIMS
jgi:hypothetical protein